MKLGVKTYLLTILSMCGLVLWGQNVERKIIIENGEYAYVTIDDYSQIGTLYKGQTGVPLSESKAYALPAGRGVSAETNPLAWDIIGSEMTAINFLDHSLNDRNEAIKQISLNELSEWGAGVEPGALLMKSVDQKMLALNAPYLFVKERSKYIRHFYFDGVWMDDAYWMVMTNNDELTVWKYEAGSWEHSEVKQFQVSNFFNLQSNEGKLIMITNEGGIYEVGLTGLRQTQLEKTGFRLTDVTLIEDRDKNRLMYLPNNQLNRDKSLSEIIDNSAIDLIRE